MQSFAERKLFLALENEMKGGCAECHMEAQQWNISFLKLKGVARNVSMKSGQTTNLFFPLVTAKFSLSKIFARRLVLSRLKLINGFSDGFSPKSPTFKFIDNLSSPIPPERDHPKRWKIELKRLELVNSKFSEDFGSISIQGSGVSLKMRRNDDGTISLSPQIKSLVYHSSDTGENVDIGELSSTILIDNDIANFKKILLTLGDSRALISATSHLKENDRLEGDLNYSLYGKDIHLPKSIGGDFEGNGQFGGELGKPTIHGNIFSPNISINVKSPLDLNFYKSSANYSVDFGPDETRFSIENLESINDNLKITSILPIKFTTTSIEGALAFNIKEVSLNQTKVKDLNVSMDLSGQISSPTVNFKGSASSITQGKFALAPVKLEGSLKDNLLSVSLNHLNTLSVSSLWKYQPEGLLFDKASVEFTSFQIPRKSDSVNLSGTVDINGPVETISANGSGNLYVGNDKYPILLEIIKDSLKIRMSHPAENIEAFITSDFPSLKTFKTTLHANEVNLRNIDQFSGCGNLTGTIEYEAPFDKPLYGNGRISLSRLVIGCSDERISLLQPYDFPIKNGVVSIDRAKISARDAVVTFNGNANLSNELSITGIGSLPLAPFRTMLPTLDDFDGILDMSVSVTGTLTKPIFQGTVALKDATIASESAHIGATEINGSATFNDQTVQITNVNGKLNGGTLSLSGDIPIKDLSNSNLRAIFDQVSFEPSINTYFLLSGDLTMIPSESLIRGNVEILNGEVRKNFDVRTILRAAINYLLRGGAQASQDLSMPDIKLDVAVKAARNSFIVTNWFGTELKADIQISGLLGSPTIEGRVESMTGWFGLNDRRFYITSGLLTFKPETPEPVLDLVGESNVISKSGESMNVILEANGPISNPRITLSSDQGLSQREILSLLVGGRGNTERNQSYTVGKELETQETFSPLAAFPFLPFRGFLSELTEINSLSLEPRYSLQTGAIEPYVIAEKNITERLALFGETSLGGTVSESRLRARYSLLPYLTASGAVESISTKQELGLGADLGVTLLSRQPKLVSIKIHGNESYSKQELLAGIRLSEGARISIDDLPGIERNIISYYKKNGFLNAKAEISCKDSLYFCSSVHIQITEGKEYLIEHIRYENDDPRAYLDEDDLNDIVSGQSATEKILSDVHTLILEQIRLEGFIAARISATYDLENNNAVLVISSRLGQPVTFSFKGNKTFRPDDFYETINLFKRKQPFGNNTIRILAENIDNLYQQSGYLFATVSHETINEGSSERVNYLITIDEGSKVPVSSVKLKGNEKISKKTIGEYIEKLGRVTANRLYYPTYAVSDEVEANAQLIQTFYREQGFPDAIVTYQLLPDDTRKTVEIRYLIEEGREEREDWLTITGWPSEIPIPQEPPSPYSIASANRFINECIMLLRDRGYQHVSLRSSFDRQKNNYSIDFTPGSLVQIESITIEGNVNVKPEAILSAIELKPGDPWNNEAIGEAKRKLFKLGLFSRVETVEQVSSSGDKLLLIRVTERPGQTLEVGGGANSEYGIHVFGEATERELFGDGRSFALRIDSYYDPTLGSISKGIASLQFLVPSVLGTDNFFNQDLRYERQERTVHEFDLNRISLASYLTRSLDNGLTISGGHTILEDDLNDVTPDAVISELDTGVVNLSFLSGALTWDRKDNPLNPRKGYSVTLDYKVASEAIASEANFHEINSRITSLWPFHIGSSQFGFSAAARLGSGWTFGGTDTVPITQRFYTGGRTSVRGFKENSLGPQGRDGAVIGGDIISVNNIEFQYFLDDLFSIHTFFDTGTVFLREDEVDLSQLRHSTGFGARFLSPIGPVGLDVGFPLDRENGESSYRIHFNIGTIF